MSLSADDVRAACREQGIRFLRLQFTDILGVVKSVDLPIQQLDKVLAGECIFDGTAVEGFVRVHESDMRLTPDPATYVQLPWKPDTARLICDVGRFDGAPYPGDPRQVLRQSLAKAEAHGWRMMVGTETEFFLFHRDAVGKPTTLTHDQASYFDLAPLDLGEQVRSDIVAALAAQGIAVEQSHHEIAPGQHEIDCVQAPALQAADQLVTLRVTARTLAARAGLHATFMPKPLNGVNGSGLHVHQSLFRGEANAFHDAGQREGLSATARHYLAGVLLHARGLSAVTNPLVNSYKRLVPGYDAPVFASWSHSEPTQMVRVPARRGTGTRIEVRTPDPACNPYLALAAMLAAGLDGVRRKLPPPPPVEQPADRMSPEERAELGIAPLPADLREALDALEADAVVREALGEALVARFAAAKAVEWEVYRARVHEWEIEQFLGTF
jgi:glutamine synthetase